MDPFDEFARAIAKDNPDEYIDPEYIDPRPSKPKNTKKNSKKKNKKEELDEYEKNYLRRLELATDEKVKVNRIKPRKVSDIHILTRKEVEEARAEIEIIKIREPDRKSQKTIPTQATILNAGIEIEDCYKIFGVDQFITCDELKEQYRKLAVKYNSSIGMIGKTKEENKIITDVHIRINQAYDELKKTHQCRG